MITNFSFVLDELLAGCAHPANSGNLNISLEQLKNKGIKGIISLDEYGLPAEELNQAGFSYKHIPIADFHPPTLSQITEFVGFVNSCKVSGAKVVAHCFAGYGRTGTMLACYLVSQGMSAQEAVETIRTKRPGSIETRDQIAAIEAYERSLK